MNSDSYFPAAMIPVAQLTMKTEGSVVDDSPVGVRPTVESRWADQLSPPSCYHLRILSPKSPSFAGAAGCRGSSLEKFRGLSLGPPRRASAHRDGTPITLRESPVGASHHTSSVSGPDQDMIPTGTEV